MTRVPVRPEVLRWACERAGYGVRDLAPPVELHGGLRPHRASRWGIPGVREAARDGPAMTKPAPLLLDADVFIAAKNAYYAFDICPGFWSGVLREFERGRIQSLDRIRNELLLGRKEGRRSGAVGHEGGARNLLSRFQCRGREFGLR